MVFDWQYRKTDELFKNSSIKNQEDEELLSVTQDSGVLPRSMLERRVVMPDGNTKNYKLVEQGDLIISLRSFQGGLEYSDYRGLVSPAYTVIKPNAPLEMDFYRQYFKSHRFINQLNSSVIGIRDGKQISYQVFKEIEIPYPPLMEQRKIADILTSVDNAISKTEAIIKQTEKVKKGLMQQLLTKGIGHTKFKKTEIGEIPEEWGVQRINQLAKVKGGKRIPKGMSLTDEATPYPYLRVSDFNGYSIDLKNIKFASEEVRSKIKIYTIAKEDIYISIAGIYLGLVGRVPKLLDGALLTENAAKITEISNDVNIEFLMFVLSSEVCQAQISQLKAATGVPKLGLNKIEIINVPLPPLEEQNTISEIFKSILSKLAVENKKLLHLFELKRALMQNLLTGKVRVKVDELEAVTT